MSQDGQEFSVREVLQFIHDALRFMRIGPLDKQGWISRDPSPDLALCITGFKGQPIVRLVENVVKHSGSDPCQLGDVIQLLQRSINIKLEWMADQGLFDVIIPWIGSIVTESRVNNVGRLWTDIRPIEQPSATTTRSADGPEEGEEAATMNPSPDPGSKSSSGVVSEVVIHVVDDVRGGHKDFTLPANVLLEKMPYFAKATKGQVLSDVDITVHCDVNIFEWLTKWMNCPNPPSLDVTNVVPVLLSAAFLETEALVEECLHFCHAHTNQILDAKQSFSCLNDQLIEKLAAKFTSAEVEQLGHQRSSIQSRLYGCLIVDLCSVNPSPKRGIFRTATTLFQCGQCGQLLTEEVQFRIPCNPGRVVLTLDGQLVHRHQRDDGWKLTEYVQGLKSALKTWRRVYWRLWSQVHFLDCANCSLPFPASDFLKCPFHPEPSATFASISRNKGNFQPIGKHPCCGQPAFRFSTLPSSHQGCRMREHSVSCTNLEQIQIMSVCQQYADLIQLSGPFKSSDPVRGANRPADNAEDVVQRFMLGLTSRPRRHLVPLPWQPEQGAPGKDSGRPKTASSSQDSASTTGSAESDDVTPKLVYRGGKLVPGELDPLHPICYEEEEEDMQDEDEAEEDPQGLSGIPGASGSKPSAAGASGRDGLMKRGVGYVGHPQTILRRGGKFSSRRETRMKPQPPAKEVDLRWNPCLSSRSNQDSQRYMEEEMFRRIVSSLTPPQWQKARSPVGGLFAKIHRVLQDKAQKELKMQQMMAGKASGSTSSRSAISAASIAALAARKFKAQLHHHPQ